VVYQPPPTPGGGGGGGVGGGGRGWLDTKTDKLSAAE